jgi:hypothetical protein
MAEGERLMTPYNYSRSAIEALKIGIKIHKKNGNTLMMNEQKHCLYVLHKAVKFMLPFGGRVLEDTELKGLDPSLKLRLPFPIIALEYPNRSPNGVDGQFIVVAREVVGKDTHTDESGDYINISMHLHTEAGWCTIPMEQILATEDYMEPIEDTSGLPDEAFPYFFKGSRHLTGDSHTDHVNGDLPMAELDQMAEFINVATADLLCFLNALACTNVGYETLDAPKKQKKGARKADAYKVLTVITGETKSAAVGGSNGSSRSPREHIRRGHIRRCASGKRVWVNACVVNKGVGGRIDKDYNIAS